MQPELRADLTLSRSTRQSYCAYQTISQLSCVSHGELGASANERSYRKHFSLRPIVLRASLYYYIYYKTSLALNRSSFHLSHTIRRLSTRHLPTKVAFSTLKVVCSANIVQRYAFFLRDKLLCDEYLRSTSPETLEKKFLERNFCRLREKNGLRGIK